ncbi:MAG: ABC transporter permease [Candidatus Bipolaricaulia bacterium]
MSTPATTPERQRSRSRQSGRLTASGRRAIQVASVLGFFLVWHLVVAIGQFPDYLLPAPLAIAEALASELRSGQLLALAADSLTHYGLGLAVGTALGMAVGVLVAWHRRLETVVEPILRLLRPIPPLAWIPFAIIWMGISQAAAAFVIAIVAFWINYYNSYAGVKGVDPQRLDAARSLGVRSPWRLIRKVVLPDATPAMLTGVRTAIGQGWMAVVAAELFGVRGLGLQMVEASGYLAMDVVMAYMLVLGVLFSVFDGGFRMLERFLLRWRAT